MMMYSIDQNLKVEANSDQKAYKNFMSRYFSSRSIAIMVVLTFSLLVLPLVLPPLPPPPLMLLGIPVLIMALLVLLAFSPTQPPNVALGSVENKL